MQLFKFVWEFNHVIFAIFDSFSYHQIYKIRYMISPASSLRLCNVTAVGEKKTESQHARIQIEISHRTNNFSPFKRLVRACMYIIWVMLPIWIIHDPNMTRYFKEISNPLNIALSLAKSLLGTGWKLWNETIPLHPSRADYLSRLTFIIRICNLL